VELSPFEVRSAPDNSYGAINSNSMTSFNAELGKLPISADIFTLAFMEDTNSTTLENMLRDFAAGSGTGSAAGDVAGIPINQPMDRGGGDNVSAGVTLRGLGAAVVKQDGFMLPSPAGTGLNSNFGMERVEVINGPQALLYGNGGGGGVVNTISRQAHFDRGAHGALKFQIDQFGHTIAQFDCGLGSRRLALALSVMRQELGDNRDWMGGPLVGHYLQVAGRIGQTTLRLTGKQTRLDRFIQQGYTVNAGSAAADARHGQNLRYLLATNQIMASASGPSGAGPIAGGHINWDNVDSFSGNLRNELTTARLASLTADTRWNGWLSTQVSAGYQSKESVLGFASALSLVSPIAPTNPLPGQWAMIGGGGSGAARSNQPSRSKSFRLSALLSNSLFSGRARSSTIVGADFTEGNYTSEGEAFYRADDSFNVIRAANGSRAIMNSPNPYWSVQNGPVETPFPWAGATRITFNGVNYVLQTQNQTDPALISPLNPQGVTGTDQYIHSRAISRGTFAVNYTQWGDGRLTTLFGVRYMYAQNRQLPSTAIPAIEASNTGMSYSFGANYAATSWLRPYFAVADTYNLPGVLLTVPADPLGKPAQISHSVGGEIGVKLGDGQGRISGSLGVYAVSATDDPYAITTNVRDSINPAGINGRHLGATGTVINVNRKSSGVHAALTAQPARNWRMRLSAAFVKGTIGSTTTYDVLYNDQFYANAQGQVTYANGTVAYVRPTFLATPGTAADAGYIPLTIAALSTPGNAYYANPDPENGVLRTSNGRTVLLAVNPAHGSIRTGVTGVPISRYQLTGVTPIDKVVTSRAGDRTTGYPEISSNFTSVYTLSGGPLRGLKVGGTANFAWRVADFYYYPNGYSATASRQVFSRPTRGTFDAILGYERKLRHLGWSTQLNVRNVFNRYEVIIRPNNITGWNGVKSALFTTQPREYTWTNVIRF
jgi:outer membrane receptor protein involved in Fe transport